MNLRSADYLMTRFAHAVPGAMKFLGDLETDVLRDRLAAIAVDRPVFIAGVARSGTTLLLNLLSQLPRVATHRYSDFPFVFTPVAWNRLQARMGAGGPPVERPHQDRIRITRDSPEAFEEPLWSHFFDGIHDPEALHRLTAADRRPEFDEFFLGHLRKVLMLREGSRYVSKGNYNVTRIEYLADLLPDARFLVPVRHPVAQVESLLRQHRLFSEYSASDPRVPEYMRAAGHFEFGPQRVPVNLDRHVGRRIAKCWKAGEDATGYAFLWNSVYDHGSRLARQDKLGPRIEFVRYEDVCGDAGRVLRCIAEFCDFEEGVEELLAGLPDISQRPRGTSLLTAVERERIWEITAQTAGSLGYERERSTS
jgi:Sulfotransferase family